jgi:cell fate (sporulation/competence/biofilm development) regulator YlbF (YheA/YmcA/DUF963 family)
VEELLKKATALGEEISRHPRVTALAAARKAVLNDREAQRLLSEHEKLVERVTQLRQQQKPIEADDKRKLAEVEAAMAAAPVFKELLRTQTDYLDLMNQVQRALETPLVRATESGGGAA